MNPFWVAERVVWILGLGPKLYEIISWLVELLYV